MLSLRVAQRASALGHVRFAPTLSTGLLKVPGRSYASPSSSSTQGSLASLVSNKALVQTTSFIGNKFVSASSSSGKTFAVHDPANNALLANVVEGASEDGPVLDAIARSQKAFESWRKTTPKVRQELLLKLYKLMQENAEDLAQIITAENGKPLADARGEVAYSASFMDWFAGEAMREYGDVIPSTIPGLRNVVIKQPVGPVGIITPWNFPSAMITRKMAPALAAGCTVVIKVPSETPFSGLAVAELSRQAGFPDDVIQVITSSTETTPRVGELLCTDKRIKKISFTGSTGVGKILAKQSSGTLKKLSLELGGNAPFIVFDDADLDAAVQGAIACKFRSSGQTCVCANRIFVHEAVFDQFSEKLVAAVKKFKLGHGAENGVTHGPLIHTRAVDKVERHVEDAVSRGARLLTGGRRLPRLGEAFYDPTILADVPADAECMTEETFGPMAALVRFANEKEVIELANDTEVGLAGYFYSRDIGRVWRVAEELQVGMVGANTGIISQATIPFGGVKESGYGREGSKYGMQDYQIIKVVCMGGLGTS